MMLRKILLLGEIGVGKTSIVQRLVFDRFDGSYKATIGTDIYRYDVAPSPASEPFQFIVWDTDGNFSDAIFRHVYAKQAHAAIIVGDVLRRTTLDAATRLGHGFMDEFPGRPLAYVVNKVDLLEAGEAPQWPAKLVDGGVPMTMTSAKTGHQVKQAFHDAASAVVRRG
jgi:small GTP-binding protein